MDMIGCEHSLKQLQAPCLRSGLCMCMCMCMARFCTWCMACACIVWGGGGVICVCVRARADQLVIRRQRNRLPLGIAVNTCLFAFTSLLLSQSAGMASVRLIGVFPSYQAGVYQACNVMLNASGASSPYWRRTHTHTHVKF